MINYERDITGLKEDTMDDSSFIALPVLKVPDASAEMMTDGSINNNDHNDLMEESIVTKDYGVTK